MATSDDSLRCELDEHLRFEDLLIDLSARFVNVPADQVDSEIEDAQRRICECLQLDASLLWQWTHEQPAGLRLTHLHRPLGGPPMPGQANFPVILPWAHAQLLAGSMYVNSSLDDLPPEAAFDRVTFENFGVKSNIGFPLLVGGGTPVGALTFNTTRRHRGWSETIIRRLRLVGQIFANALARKQADAQERLRMLQLAHLNRVATMGELASALAHELNQPLGAILRNAEAAALLLQHDTPDLEELAAIVADIKRDDERAGGIIDRSRNLLRQHRIDLQTTELPRLVDEVVSLVLAEAAARGIHVISAVPADMPAVSCDRVHVQQVLLNLIMNGLEAIRAARDGDGDPRVTIRARLGGEQQVEVSVDDTGPGITPEDLPSLFDPFFTTKAGGMGMGLAISRTLVEAHGGKLWADAAAGPGACFHFTLPAIAQGGTP